MAATDSQSLLTQAQCYLCYNLSIYQGMKLALLAQIALAHNSAADVTPQSLVSQGKCFACYANGDLGKVMELSLLSIIAT